MHSISILTPSYNQARYIEQNIISVLCQDYPACEHIIIDGGSTDSTVEVLKKYDHLKWASERDRGQADALNKGLAVSGGDIIGWINSDDFYERDIFSSVAEQFEDPEVRWVIGNLCFYQGERGVYDYDTSPAITYDRLLNDPDIVRQPPAFFRRSILERAGRWDADYHMTMDLDLWTRLARISTPLMVDRNWAYFRIHPGQKTSNGNRQRQAREIIRILKREKASGNVIMRIFMKKQWYALKGAVKSILTA